MGNRQEYLGKLINIIGTPDIKIISGVRCKGRSKLLECFKEYILKNLVDVNIIYINFKLIKFEDLKEYHALENCIVYVYGKENFVMIDEVQMCPKFELAVF